MSENKNNHVKTAIRERLARASSIDDLKKANQQKAEKKIAWTGDFRQHWYVYILLLISGVFTATLGIFMGLSPTLVTLPDGAQVIHFNTDITHLFLALVYMVAFVGTTEVQFIVAKKLFSDREEGNFWQTASMVTAMITATIGIVGTGIAGGFVVASNIAFLSDFREIPHEAQRWVIIIIPIMLAWFSVLYLIYSQTSEAAQNERLLRDTRRRLEQEARLEMMQAELAAESLLQEEEINEYWKLVESGKIDAGTARANIRAGKTLGQYEKEIGRDLDGKDGIGNQDRGSQPMGGGNQNNRSNSGRVWRTDELLSELGFKSRQEASEVYQGNYRSFAREAHRAVDIADDNVAQIWNEFGSFTPADRSNHQ